MKSLKFNFFDFGKYENWTDFQQKIIFYFYVY